MKRGKKLFTYLLVLVMLLANTVTGVAGRAVAGGNADCS